MATTAAVLEIAVRANTGAATTQLRQMDRTLGNTAKSGRTAAASTDKLSRSSQTLGTTMRGAIKYAVGLGAAYVGLQAAKQAVTATTDLAKATLTLHKGFGLSIRTGSELGAVLKARGADATSMGMAFNTLSRQIEAAKKGTATAVDAFHSLGISQEEIKKSSPDKLLFAVSDGMEALGRGTERTATTSTLFGRGWKTIGPVLRAGSKDLKDQLDLANQYGAAFGGKSISSIEDLIKTERELKIAQLGLQVQFTEKIAPALIKIGLAVAGAVQWFEKLSPTVRTAALAIGTLAGAIWLAVKAQAAFDAAAAMNPYVALAAAVAIAAILIIKHWNAIKRAVGDAFAFIKKHALLMGLALAPFTGGMTVLAAVVFKNWDKIKGAFQAGIHVIKTLAGVASSVFSVVKNTVVDTGKAIIGVLAKIVRVVSHVIDAFNSLKSAPGNILKGAADKLNPANLFNGLQTGGVIVSGSGSGDKVPAMLEPGEVVLNRKAVSRLGGTRRANEINSMIPRFAGGGVIGGGVDQAGRAGASLAAAGAMELLRTLAKKAGPSGKGGTKPMDGHPVATWIWQILTKARKAGVGFHVSSGFRSLAEQTAIYNSGVRPAAPPGTSHHESTAYPGGAVDLSPGAAALAAWLQTAKGMRVNNGRLVYAGAADPVHFSHPYGGGYQAGGPVPKHGTHWIQGGSHWDKNEAATLLWQAGLSESDAAQLSRVVGPESGGDPGIVNSIGATGLFQIHPGNSRLRDPILNALAAVAKYRDGGMSPWVSSQGGWTSPGHILRGRVMDTKSAPKGKGKKGKKGKGGGGGGDDSWVQDMLDAAQAAIDIQNERIGSANSLIGEGNLELLQRYQTGVAQNPLLGIASPGMPSLAASLPFLPPATLDSLGINTVGSSGSSTFNVGRHHTPHIHNHFYIDGREIRGITKKEMRKSARGGHRPLPSRGGGI